MMKMSSVFFVLLLVMSAAQSSPAGAKTAVQEIHFGYYPRFRPERLDDQFVTIRRGGEAYALKFDSSGGKVFAAYEGRLSGRDWARLAARVEEAFGEVERAGPPDPDIAYEGDIIYLAVKTEGGAIREMGRMASSLPESVWDLLRDLSMLWKRLQEVPPAAGYLRSRRMNRERFESLQRKDPKLLVAVEEFPPDLRPIVAEVIDTPEYFKPISREQYEKLRAQRSLVVSHKGSGYYLYLFTSRE